MSIGSILKSCSNWPPVAFVRDSQYGMPTVQSFHLLALTLLLATVVVLNLRLAGVGLKNHGLAWLGRQLRPWTLGALAVMLASGALIFLATPGKYLDSRPFQIKMTLLGAALLFHFTVFRSFIHSDSTARRRAVQVWVACLSVTLWFSVGWAGRAIAFLP